MVIGDSFSAIFAGAGLPAALASRTGAILFMTLLFTLPLSLLPNLEILQYTSFLGLGGLVYTAAFMVARVSAYAPGSALTAAVPAAATTNDSNDSLPAPRTPGNELTAYPRVALARNSATRIRSTAAPRRSSCEETSRFRRRA